MIKFIKDKCRLYETRFSFGATAAIITNLGLIVGLRTDVHAKISIIGGMLIIALADNISDSVGIHIYQESECIETREIWISTISNFITRLLVSLIFILLVIFLPIKIAVISSVVWGLFLLGAMSYKIAKDKGVNPYTALFEHVGIALLVIIASNFIGKLLIARFNL
ncbi:MAG: hypothetical protein NTW13_03580 [Candidatus Omnitrophica bacterium]|nr:hypothetical protein [Candidatus Omnitrophota bacterium]